MMKFLQLSHNLFWNIFDDGILQLSPDLTGNNLDADVFAAEV